MDLKEFPCSCLQLDDFIGTSMSQQLLGIDWGPFGGLLTFHPAQPAGHVSVFAVLWFLTKVLCTDDSHQPQLHFLW